jgi:hypothetical protein
MEERPAGGPETAPRTRQKPSLGPLRGNLEARAAINSQKRTYNRDAFAPSYLADQITTNEV